MKRIYNHFVLYFLLLLIIPFKGFSSHIVGGTLTYTYNGGNNYTVQLKLYRDCSGIAFPASAAITVLQADGSLFSPTRNFTLPGGAITNIPAVLPPCATSPSVTPCVEERVFTSTVNLAPSPGGMHLYYSLCCRNPSILNINAPAAAGETFYCYIPCYFDTWKEDFTLANGTTSDAGPTAWTRTLGATPPVSAQVNNGEFEVLGTGNATATWASQVVNISAFTSGVNLSVNARRVGTMQNGDSLKISYSINGGPKVLFPVNGNLPGAFATPAFATATGLVGNTIQIFVRATFNATTTASSKAYDIDMATIYDNTFLPNSNPSFTNLPPLFVCSTNTFAINYSATDADGDLLVYSMYTPYNDAPAPTFPNNTAQMTPVTWIPNYSANSPFNSPAPAVTLNSSTGLLTGVANTNGQFVFGVKVQEWRGGKLLSESVRDYQMNTVTCPPFVPPPPTAGANTPLCIAQTLSLTASTVAGATYQWTGPNGFTSTLQNPTISNVTALAAGVYSVQAIIAGCTGIAGTVTVTINPKPAAPTAGGNSPICAGATLSLSASNIAGASYNWNGPNTFTSTTQNPTIPGATVAAGGVYSVSATVLGCTGPAGTVNIVVNATPPTPTATANSPLCVGQTLSLTSSTIAGATFSWSGPNAFTSTLQNPTIPAVTLAAAGVYSVTATTSGCTSTTGTVNVVVNPIPAAPTAGSNAPLCVGQTLSLTSSTIASASYNWSGPNSFTSSTQNPNIPSISLLGAGVYSVTATVLGCTGPAGTVNVVVNNLPIAPTPTANTPLCIGQNLNLSASTIAGATYNWSGPNSFTSAVQSPTINGVTLAASGVYSVNAVVGGCAGPNGTINVVVNPLPAAPTAVSNAPLCQGQTLNLNASTIAGATYTWTGPNTFTANIQNPSVPSIGLTGAGIYSVSAIVLGCTGPTGTINVVVNPTPSVPTATANTPLCVGQTLNLGASTIPGATYNWSGPNSFVSIIQNPSIIGVTVLASGTYSVAASALGCTSAPGLVNVVVNPLPAAPTATATSPVCVGQTINLGASTLAGATYSWTGPNTFTSNIQNPSVPGAVVFSAGIYSVSAVVLGCAGPEGTVNVVVNPLPSAPIPGSNAPLCAGQTLSLTASNIPGASYNWTGPNSFTSTTQNPSIVPTTTLTSGIYSVNATLAGCAGPSGTLNVIVNPVPAAPTATANAPLCAGQNLFLGASNIPGGIYSWTGPNSFTSAVQNPTIVGTTTLSSGTYSVSATVLGCASPISTVSVLVNPLPAPVVAGSNGPLCASATLSLTANTIVGATYNWSGPNSFTSTTQNPVLTNVTTLESGVYSVNATILGCTGSTGTVNVVINPIPATPTISTNSPLCEGQDLNLGTSAVTGGVYNWTGPNSFTSSVQNPTIVATTSLATGVYSLNVSVGGCSSLTSTVSVIVNPTPAPVVVGSNAPICAGTTLTLTASNIVGAVYSWTGPNSYTSAVQNPTIAAASTTMSGTYSLNVTVLGCTGSSGTVSVLISPPVAAPTITATSPACEGQDIYLSASTIAGATYSWTGPNSFTASVQNPTVTPTTTLSAGVYSVQATVAGCSSPVSTVTITVNPTPLPPDPGSNSPLCEGQTLNLTASNVTGATYNWTGPNSFTSTTQNPSIASTTSLSAGVYSVNVTVGGCTSRDTTINVIINPLPAPVIVGSNSPLCVGATLSLTASNITGATYNWVGPNSFTASVQNPTLTNVTLLETGTYSVSVTVAGCTGTSGTVSVLVSPPVAAPTATANSPICEGQDIYLSASTITGATYNWVGPNSYTAAIQNPTVTPTTTLSAGIYSVSATVAGCTGPFGTISVSVNPSPAPPTLGSNSPICTGQTLSLTASPIAGATYSWTGPNSFTAATQDSTILNASTAASGDYSVVVVVAGCPSTVAIISATVNPTPAAPTPTANSPLCVGSTLNLDAGILAGATYSWTGPNTFTSNIQNPSVTSTSTLSSGIYSVTATVAGCESPVGTVTVLVTDPALVNAGLNDTICASAFVLTLNGTMTPGYNITWTSLGTGTITNPTSLVTTYSMSAADTTAGSITFVLTSSGGGCPMTVTDTIVFTVLKGPMAYAGADINVCKNATIPLNGLITGVTSTGQWLSTGTGTFNPNNTVLNGYYQPSSSDTASASIQLILESTNNKGCLPSRDTLKVNFINAPTAAFTFTNACANQPVVFNNNSTPSASITTYSWDFGDASGTSTQINPNYTYTVGNTYTVTLIVTNNIGCTDTLKQAVPIYIAPTANFTFSNVCVGTTGMFNDASTVTTGSIVTWAWTFGDGGNSTAQNPTHTYTTSTVYSVNLTVVSSNSCTGTVTKTITVNPKPNADFNMNPNPAYGNQTVNFTDLSTPTGSITTWNWTYAYGQSNSSGSSQQNPSYVYDDNGVFTVQLIVGDANGCSDTARKDIIVILLPQVPTAFTPNGDGHNDVLFVKGGPFKTMYFRVYNNWGEKLFESTKQEEGWDGTYKGEKVQLGVYVWILDVEMFDGQQIRKTGDVTILK